MVSTVTYALLLRDASLLRQISPLADGEVGIREDINPHEQRVHTFVSRHVPDMLDEVTARDRLVSLFRLFKASAIVHWEDSERRILCESFGTTDPREIFLSRVLSANEITSQRELAGPIDDSIELLDVVHTHSVLRAIDISLRVPELRTALRNIYQGLNWDNLYRVYELVLAANGGEFVREHFPAADRFTGTANDPRIAGEGARHATRSGNRMANPLSLEESSEGIFRLIDAWVTALSRQPPN